MGLFQRSSHRGQQHQEQPPQFHPQSFASDPRHAQVFGMNDEQQENQRPSFVAGQASNSKRRGLLVGLIRSRPDRQSQLPPTHHHPHHQLPASLHPQVPLAPSPLQNVPFPVSSQQELRQKLQDAQKVEAFLTQAGTFKPTIGGSDIEFLFNNIATPTATSNPQHPHSAATIGTRNQGGQLNLRDQRRRLSLPSSRQQQQQQQQQQQHHHQQQQQQHQQRDTSSVASSDFIASARNPAAYSPSVDPQSPFHQPRQHRQPQPSLPAQRTTHPFASGGDQSTHSDFQSLSSSINTPQHVMRSSPQIQSWVDTNTLDSHSIDSSKQRSNKKSKKNARRRLFSTRSDLDAFESEEAYYNAMKALDEGRQFQNVSKAFIQHFNNTNSNNNSNPSNQEATSQSSSKTKPSKSSKSYQQNISAPGNEKPPHKTSTRSHDDGVSYHTRESSSHRSSAISSKQEYDATPLKGILRTDGKFGGVGSVKSYGVGTVEGDSLGIQSMMGDSRKDEEAEEGGAFDVYTSSSGDEMFIGIRPSSSSEASSLYTDEHELIELRACLNSSSQEEKGQQEGEVEPEAAPSFLHHHKFDDRRAEPQKRQLETSRLHDGSDGRRAEPQKRRPAPSIPEHPIEQLSRGRLSSEREHVDQVSRNAVVEEINPLDSSKVLDLQANSSENSDVFKAVQERFADMINSVGTFHEKQAQKIEEIKKSFISTISPATVPVINENTQPESAANTKWEQPKAGTVLVPQPLPCNGLPPDGFDQRDKVVKETAVIDKQDELYRNL
jgi:hypothetical protein